MTEFVKVANLSQIRDNGRLTVEIDDRIVVLFRIGEEIFCIDDVCTHDGGPLGDGPLDGYCVACPRHGATFDVRTGQVLSMPATASTAAHQVRIDGADILVCLSDD